MPALDANQVHSFIGVSAYRAGESAVIECSAPLDFTVLAVSELLLRCDLP